MIQPTPEFAKAVRQAGAAIANLIGILGTWESSQADDMRLRHIATDRLQQSRAALLDLWQIVKAAAEVEPPFKKR
jgi:hypothetical protein